MSFLRTACTLTVALSALIASAAPTSPNVQSLDIRQSGTSFWMESIGRQGFTWGNAANYDIYRNVKDFGAKGDGVTDDTAAINLAISSSKGNARCGNKPYCDSSTTTPAIVYFPAGKYRVRSPIVMYYYTQLIGNPNDMPTIIADKSFEGMAVLDADPYDGTGTNWWTNQNNFFRQARNFHINLLEMDESQGAGVHWQVAQATSLQNIVFDMHPPSSRNKQMGIFMDNGSGGFFSDLIFNGGYIGVFLGSQQFTTRNLVFNGCGTAIFMNWNWGWTLSDVTINGCGTVGLDMANSPTNLTVGSVVLSDSVISNCPVGVSIAWAQKIEPVSGGNLILDNVDMTNNVPVAVQSTTGPNTAATILLQGNTLVKAWAAGSGYAVNYPVQSTYQVQRNAGPITPPIKAASLLDASGKIYGRSKPQYESYPASSFMSARSAGCKGDGQTDDTACLQTFFNSVPVGKIAYLDHGAYIVTNTITIPKSIIIVGEIWAMIVATGFTDVKNPKPVFQIGMPGDTGGAVEISDLIWETKGPNPGAIMVQWNLQSDQGKSGVWDSHVRIGGSYGTQLQSDKCTKSQQLAECTGVFLMFYAPPGSKGIYLENCWFWVADHDLDLSSPTQISVYSGRGVLIESQGPTWLWGTASEHSVLYNYQFKSARALFSGFMQSETPYYQPTPDSLDTPFAPDSRYDDPEFTICENSKSSTCKMAWGLRIWDSFEVLIYSTGLYSFFNSYDQGCVSGQNCQDNIIRIQASQVHMYAVSTKASVNMIVDDDVGIVKDVDHRSNFCATIAYYFTNH